jgi:hypothetical protein
MKTGDKFKTWSRGYFLYSFCKAHGFEPYANIDKSYDKQAIVFKPLSKKDWLGNDVYLWTEEYRSRVRIVYIGKAEKQKMKDRCNQHSKGKSNVGKEHTADILDGLSKRRRYCVYAREASSDCIRGEKDIPMCHVEELAFIQMLKKRGFKLWNKPPKNEE